MGRPSTSREALLLETLDDVAQLFDRIEALSAQMESTRRALSDANAELAAQVERISTHKGALDRRTGPDMHPRLIATTNDRTGDHPTARLDAAIARALSTHVQPLLMQAVEPLLQSCRQVTRPWDTWLTHAATAACSATLTWWTMTAHLQR